MTYCVGILVRGGLVMIADTRTNAGVDNIATFRKLVVCEKPGERVIAATDCGLGGRVHPQVAWAKLEALAQGAELASA